MAVDLPERAFDILIQTDLLGESVLLHYGVSGAYVLPVVVLLILFFLFLLGLLAKLQHKLSCANKDIDLARRELRRIKGETEKASSKLTKLKHKLDAQEKKSVDKALDKIDSGDDAKHKFDQQSKRKLWSMMESDLKKK